jgi:hypothetical protein
LIGFLDELLIVGLESFWVSGAFKFLKIFKEAWKAQKSFSIFSKFFFSKLSKFRLNTPNN